MNFGQANYILTKYLKSRLLVWQIPQTNSYYLFQKKSQKRLSDDTLSEYFECRNCIIHSGSDRQVSRIVVKNDIIVTDPDASHKPECLPSTFGEVEALKLSREARETCSQDSSRPLVVYRQTLNEIPRRIADPNDQAAVSVEFPSYKKIRSSLYRYEENFV